LSPTDNRSLLSRHIYELYPVGCATAQFLCVFSGYLHYIASDTSLKPSGYLSCLAHVLCKILEVEPTLVGRILEVGLTCTNLPRDCATSHVTKNQVACPFGRLVFTGVPWVFLRDDAR